MKKCSRCEEVKPLSEFYRQDGTKDGLRSYCKECFKFMVKQKPQRIPTVSPNGKQLLTVKQVSEKMGVRQNTVYKWIHSRSDGLTVIRFGAGRHHHIRIASDELDAWLARPDY